MQDLIFEEKTIRVIEHDGSVWLGASDIARALGYSEPRKVTRLYDRHSAEFTESMTKLIMVNDLDAQSGHPGQSRLRRVFSLRGAHLVAMFARTGPGQRFRRWLLDLIEAQSSPRRLSLIEDFYQAEAELKAQERFASFCGRGLNEHKRVKPELTTRRDAALHVMQPALFLN